MNEKKENNIIDFQAKRKANIESKKRSFERHVLDQFLGLSLAAGKGSLFSEDFIELIDISKDGLSFQIPWRKKSREIRPEVGEEMTLEMGFDRDHFLPVYAKIVRTTEVVSDRGVFLRFGCQVDSSTTSYRCFEKFVQFIEDYAEFSVRKEGKSRKSS